MPQKRKRYYVVMVKRGWQSVELRGPFGTPVQMKPSDDPNEPCGFLPVFTTKRAAMKFAHGDPVLPIREVPRAPAS